MVGRGWGGVPLTSSRTALSMVGRQGWGGVRGDLRESTADQPFIADTRPPSRIVRLFKGYQLMSSAHRGAAKKQCVLRFKCPEVEQLHGRSGWGGETFPMLFPVGVR